jgi:hypothetical protein
MNCDHKPNIPTSLTPFQATPSENSISELSETLPRTVLNGRRGDLT